MNKTSDPLARAINLAVWNQPDKHMNTRKLLPKEDAEIRRHIFEGGGGCQDPRRWFQRHENLYSALFYITLALGVFLTWHWGHCAFAPTELLPVEGTTKAMWHLERHWFGRNEWTKLEARRDENGDWHWMAKSEKTGEWYPFIDFADYP